MGRLVLLLPGAIATVAFLSWITSLLAEVAAHLRALVPA